ncbi:MAG TPA: hypothetical protein P5161_02985, partial [Eubacteriales bacterium]|nr:hypothetical protein [Eubacteriales bacterium]
NGVTENITRYTSISINFNPEKFNNLLIAIGRIIVEVLCADTEVTTNPIYIMPDRAEFETESAYNTARAAYLAAWRAKFKSAPHQMTLFLIDAISGAVGFDLMGLFNFNFLGFDLGGFLGNILPSISMLLASLMPFPLAYEPCESALYSAAYNPAVHGTLRPSNVRTIMGQTVYTNVTTGDYRVYVLEGGEYKVPSRDRLNHIAAGSYAGVYVINSQARMTIYIDKLAENEIAEIDININHRPMNGNSLAKGEWCEVSIVSNGLNFKSVSTVEDTYGNLGNPIYAEQLTLTVISNPFDPVELDPAKLLNESFYPQKVGALFYDGTDSRGTNFYDYLNFNYGGGVNISWDTSHVILSPGADSYIYGYVQNILYMVIPVTVSDTWSFNRIKNYDGSTISIDQLGGASTALPDAVRVYFANNKFKYMSVEGAGAKIKIGEDKFLTDNMGNYILTEGSIAWDTKKVYRILAEDKTRPFAEYDIMLDLELANINDLEGGTYFVFFTYQAGGAAPVTAYTVMSVKNRAVAELKNPKTIKISSMTYDSFAKNYTPAAMIQGENGLLISGLNASNVADYIRSFKMDASLNYPNVYVGYTGGSKAYLSAEWDLTNLLSIINAPGWTPDQGFWCYVSVIVGKREKIPQRIDNVFVYMEARKVQSIAGNISYNPYLESGGLLAGYSLDVMYDIGYIAYNAELHADYPIYKLTGKTMALATAEEKLAGESLFVRPADKGVYYKYKTVVSLILPEDLGDISYLGQGSFEARLAIGGSDTWWSYETVRTVTVAAKTACPLTLNLSDTQAANPMWYLTDAYSKLNVTFGDGTKLDLDAYWDTLTYYLDYDYRVHGRAVAGENYTDAGYTLYYLDAVANLYRPASPEQAAAGKSLFVKDFARYDAALFGAVIPGTGLTTLGFKLFTRDGTVYSEYNGGAAENLYVKNATAFSYDSNRAYATVEAGAGANGALGAANGERQLLRLTVRTSKMTLTDVYFAAEQSGGNYVPASASGEYAVNVYLSAVENYFRSDVENGVYTGAGTQAYIKYLVNGIEYIRPAKVTYWELPAGGASAITNGSVVYAWIGRARFAVTVSLVDLASLNIAGMTGTTGSYAMDYVKFGALPATGSMLLSDGKTVNFNIVWNNGVAFTSGTDAVKNVTAKLTSPQFINDHVITVALHVLNNTAEIDASSRSVDNIYLVSSFEEKPSMTITLGGGEYLVSGVKRTYADGNFTF